MHLCVAASARGRGVARLLFEAFRGRTRDAHGALVRCREDYPASALWPKLGFRVADERDARKAGKRLRVWWLDYGAADLFSALARSLSAAVVDANVFFDLLTPTNPRSTESNALQAAWVRDAFRLAITPELFTEIDRARTLDGRRQARHFASSFTEVAATSADHATALEQVQAILGPPATARDVSDQRQIAHAAMGGATYFVTRDKAVLRAAEPFAEVLGLTVVRPLHLISRVDATERPEHYAPGRLDGSQLTVRAAHAKDEADIRSVFLNAKRQESSAGLPQVVREALADCRSTDTVLVCGEGGAPEATIVTKRSEAMATIRALRVRRDGLGPTLARHLLWCAVTESVARGADLIRFTDAAPQDDVEDALAEVGFVRAGREWIKVNVSGALPYAAALARVAEIADRHGLDHAVRPITDALRLGWRAGAPAEAAALERALWPLKLRDADLPSFLVPIQPAWAAQLFDGTMAAEQLFNSDAERLLRFENAYYRAARPAVLAAPGRVLWYVSAEPGYSHAKYVCAASAITEVVTARAAMLYRRFRRFGVFPRAAVLGLAGGPGRPLMAFTFAHTTILPQPIPLAALRAAVRGTTGKDLMLQSPSRLRGDLWCDLYAGANARAAPPPAAHDVPLADVSGGRGSPARRAVAASEAR